ncbi:PCYCGC motif-containing (lipo)protein [Fictibacillus sp. S7]|uniref:PCYCGC motif-containing (lipo)protein n=1 Tax=Fictibacillus sp. S7 TaxID=2212476 RepID=UPI0010123BF1|nr:PCYCGC motif-containing (lipo)protein [Fictibacillus sp. S7]RXZ02151.1 hypothetical protein DMO16_22300 [Fictibacillus sp. S7]
MKGRLLIIPLVMSFLIACSNQEQQASQGSHQEHEQSQTQNTGDIREEKANVESLPRFFVKQPKEIQVIYQAAANHKELLEKIPCYCRCGESINHKNNYDCFVHENKEDGAVTWDDHGTKCDVCLKIAAQSVKDFDQGMSIKEIREKVDKTYQKGDANPTPIPEI